MIMNRTNNKIELRKYNWRADSCPLPICFNNHERRSPRPVEDADMLAVEIRVFDESALSHAMTGMREWLDHRRCELATFRYTFVSPGVVCRVEFSSEAEAAEFAAAFGGRVVGT